MIKKSTTRDIIRKEAVRAAARLYAAENYRRWATTKVYGQQIQAVYKLAYKELAERHPKMKWLQALMETPSKDIDLKLVLRIPGKDIEIDIPGGDVKLSAIAHGGGKDLLIELLLILQEFGIERHPELPRIEPPMDIDAAFEQAEQIMSESNEQ